MEISEKTTQIAICYDFDGTLSPENMQEVSFIPALGMTKEDFWEKVKEDARANNMDEVLAYMNLMIVEAEKKNIELSPYHLNKYGKDIELFDGLTSWFDRINEYAAKHNITARHYIISSGIEEMIRGTPIGKKFDHIFACRFVYNNRHAIKPATAVNYTNKTQFLFRINKGIFNYWDSKNLNRYTPLEEKYIPFTNMVYIGDGETDVPSMKMIMYQGGNAIAVYNPKKTGSKETAIDIFKHNRANFIAPTDYSEGSQIEIIIKNVIDKIAVQTKSTQIIKAIEKEIG